MKTAYLIGIGGAGLSGLARYLHQNGYLIFGADNSDNDVCQKLRTDIGATIYTEHTADNVPEHCDLVVYSPAVSPDNPERIVAVEREISQYTYPEYLGVISVNKKTIAIAGTNGKTTTTTMVATVLDELGLDPTVIVGGQMPRFGSNFKAGDSDLFVVEACEYKESFMSLHPDIVVMTNITPDHLDYFGTVENYVGVFQKFVDRLPKDGVLVTDPNAQHIYIIAQNAEQRGITVIDYTQYAQHSWDLPIPGQYNVHNAAAALTTCLQLNLETSIVQKTIETKFETADRRFQLLGMTTDGAPVYDDYAHNVEALDVLITGVREHYGDKKIVLVYQLHEYSRTENFLDGWVQQLSRPDVVRLMPIYGAREKPKDFSIRSQDVVSQVTEKVNGMDITCVDSVENAVEVIEDANYNNDHIIICAGAGMADQVGKLLVA